VQQQLTYTDAAINSTCFARSTDVVQVILTINSLMLYRGKMEQDNEKNNRAYKVGFI